MNTLIIDDSRATRAILKSYVRQYDPTGHIYESGTPQDALAKLRDIEFIDVITLDQNIDDRVSGLDLIPNIHELKPNSQIVMITSECTTELKAQAIEFGLEFVCKPINSNKLKKFFIT